MHPPHRLSPSSVDGSNPLGGEGASESLRGAESESAEGIRPATEESRVAAGELVTSGRSSERMGIDASASVSPAIYFRRTASSMACNSDSLAGEGASESLRDAESESTEGEGTFRLAFEESRASREGASNRSGR